jgi:hypothetical protein
MPTFGPRSLALVLRGLPQLPIVSVTLQSLGVCWTLGKPRLLLLDRTHRDRKTKACQPHVGEFTPKELALVIVALAWVLRAPPMHEPHARLTALLVVDLAEACWRNFERLDRILCCLWG